MNNNVQYLEADRRPAQAGRLPAAVPLAAPRITEDQCQTISRWSVVGNDRLFGSIHNRPGAEDGVRIMTSPIVQVRFVGIDRTPVAFTESGNAYWLDAPASSFGMDRAATFLWHKSRAPFEAERRPQPGSQTALVQLMD